MGEGLFVHASNSLGVISIACSIIVPFEEEKKKRTETVQHCGTSFQFANLMGEGSRSLIKPSGIF